MISIVDYIFEGGMTLSQLQASRDEMLRRRGFGGRSLAAGPTKIEVPMPVSGPVKVAAPDIHAVEGPHAVDMNTWVSKGLKKAAEAAAEK
jgi:hypothetical protein